MQNSFEDNLTGWFLRKTSPNAVRRVADLPIAIASSVGLVRKENQDRVAVFRFGEASGRQHILVALCDGMGGMEDGAACAARALASFSVAVIESSLRIRPERCLSDAAIYANRRVYESYRGSGGATLSAILILSDRNENYWVNVGDSRIHRFGEKSIRQLTVDDTLAGQLAREPNTYLGRNELLQFIGAPVVEPHVGKDENIDERTTYLISSDGVHFLPPNMLHELKVHAPEPAIAARRLIDLALWCGGHDNASLAIGSLSRDFFKSLPALQLGTVEVWDPFGEVRFFGVASLLDRPSALPSNEPDAHGDSTGQNDVQYPNKVPSRVSEPTNLTANSGDKRKVVDLLGKPSAKRKKATKKKGASNERQSNDADDLVPQLTINFRKKDETK